MMDLNTSVDTKKGAGAVPLCIKLPQLSGYAKYFDDNNEFMNFLVHGKKIIRNK